MPTGEYTTLLLLELLLHETTNVKNKNAKKER